MRDRYHVVLGDLAGAAAAFPADAEELDRILAPAGRVPPDGGDCSLDTTLGLVVERVSELGADLSRRMRDQGDRLRVVQVRYQTADRSTQDLFDHLMERA